MSEENITTKVYSLIKNKNYSASIDELKKISNSQSNSISIYSLLGYCYFQIQDFLNASEYYEKLIKLSPENQNYKLYLAQSLFQADFNDKSLQVLESIELTEENSSYINQLRAAISYKTNDSQSLEEALTKFSESDPTFINNKACYHFIQGEFREALDHFKKIMKQNCPKSVYNVALCYYKLGLFDNSLELIEQILEKAYSEHPEYEKKFKIPYKFTDQVRYDLCMIEAINLKACIHYERREIGITKNTIDKLPFNKIEEYDSISLHNKAILDFENDPNDCYYKLNFLLNSSNFTKESIGNLLILYLRQEHYQLIDDLMKEFGEQLNEMLLNNTLKDVIYVTLMAKESPEDAYNYLEPIIQKESEKLMQQTRRNQKNDDQVLLLFLMLQSKILWDLKQYEMVEKTLLRFSDYFQTEPRWIMNLSNAIFMQESRFKEAISLYEKVLSDRLKPSKVLEIDAMAIANLCVSYIMVNENSSAEKIMKIVELAEDKTDEGEGSEIHSCMIKLIIGTLYCVKGNYDFGINRIIKSLDPIEKRLTLETWTCTKRAVVSMIEGMASGFLLIQQKVLNETNDFLLACEKRTHMVKTLERIGSEDCNLIYYEARRIRALLAKFITKVLF